MQAVIDHLLTLPPFAMNAASKSELYRNALADLTRHHTEHSPEFRRIANLLAEDLPFLPVRLFKEFDLRSVPASEVIKTITSSGTSGQAVSRIHLDRITATNQTKALVKIVSSFTGPKRLPLLIIDTPSVIKDRALFSARGAGILGFSMLGCDPTYLLNDDHSINFLRLNVFLEKHASESILVFGFTFIIWQYLCMALKQAGCNLKLSGILIHGGGWKKLTSLAVDNSTFKATIAETTGIATVHNYYGMVEQTGSIFMECSHGALHASVFSDIIVRDPITLRPLPPNHTGLLQLVSLLPTSYPGHSILTEDLGEILGVDDCPCGRRGTYFHLHGRVQNAELRGCSDVYAPHA